MKSDEKRSHRINHLLDIALRGEYTKNGQFLSHLVVIDGLKMGVSETTAKSYAIAVINRLQKLGHVK